MLLNVTVNIGTARFLTLVCCRNNRSRSFSYGFQRKTVEVSFNGGNGEWGLNYLGPPPRAPPKRTAKSKRQTQQPVYRRWEQSAGHYSRAIISRTRVLGDPAGSTAIKILTCHHFPAAWPPLREKKLSPRIAVGSRRHRRLLGFSEAVIGDQTDAWGSLAASRIETQTSRLGFAWRIQRSRVYHCCSWISL
jgi:hypothetical protein